MLVQINSGYAFIFQGSTFEIEPINGQWLVKHTELPGCTFLVNATTSLYEIGRYCEMLAKAILEAALDVVEF